jgi:diguanylate cyclase (GGDEF)-like protein
MDPQRQTVLVIDDTPANIDLLTYILQDEAGILSATKGSDGLALAIDTQPDLILLDVLMPGMDGYEVCALLKADARTRSIPVIFISAMSQEGDEAKGLEAGAIDYIAKPFNSTIVRMRVRNHLELKRYRDRLESLSLTDGLTGIANRRRFDEFFDREWRRAARNRAPLALILMDIDLFKAFNDAYGHPAGDDCLRRLAGALVESTHRPADLVARYGGEEFIAVLPDTTAEGARRVAEQIRRRVTELAIPHEHSAGGGFVTFSFGVASVVPQPGHPATELLERTDRFLYEAKQSGRNRICG